MTLTNLKRSNFELKNLNNFKETKFCCLQICIRQFSSLAVRFIEFFFQFGKKILKHVRHFWQTGKIGLQKREMILIEVNGPKVNSPWCFQIKILPFLLFVIKSLFKMSNTWKCLTHYFLTFCPAVLVFTFNVEAQISSFNFWLIWANSRTRKKKKLN